MTNELNSSSVICTANTVIANIIQNLFKRATQN